MIVMQNLWRLCNKPLILVKINANRRTLEYVEAMDNIGYRDYFFRFFLLIKMGKNKFIILTDETMNWWCKNQITSNFSTRLYDLSATLQITQVPALTLPTMKCQNAIQNVRWIAFGRWLSVCNICWKYSSTLNSFLSIDCDLTSTASRW